MGTLRLIALTSSKENDLNFDDFYENVPRKCSHCEMFSEVSKTHTSRYKYLAARQLPVEK